MAGINKGDTGIKTVMLGTEQIQKVYVGTNEAWHHRPKVVVRDVSFLTSGSAITNWDGNDLLFVVAYNGADSGGSAAWPTVPASPTWLGSRSINEAECKAYARYIRRSDLSGWIGTWNAQIIIAVTFTSQASGYPAYGANGVSGQGFANSIGSEAVTVTQTDGKSAIVKVLCGYNSAGSTAPSAPDGFTSIGSHSGTASCLVLTKNDTTEDNALSSVSMPTQNGWNGASFTIEATAAP